MALKPWTGFNKDPVFLRGAEVHDILDAGPVIPAPVKDDDFAGCREMLHIALGIKLRFFAIGWSRQGDQMEHARTHAFHDGLDGAALAGGIAPFEYDDRPQS